MNECTNKPCAFLCLQRKFLDKSCFSTLEKNRGSVLCVSPSQKSPEARRVWLGITRLSAEVDGTYDSLARITVLG